MPPSTKLASMPTGAQYGVRHRGRRRLSVRAADRDALPPRDELRQHLAAVEMSLPVRARRRTRGCARSIAELTTTACAPRDVFAAMADRHRRAFAAQLFDQRRCLHVGSGHRCAARQQKARDRAHADPADADEVDGLPGHALVFSRRKPIDPGENASQAASPRLQARRPQRAAFRARRLRPTRERTHAIAVRSSPSATTTAAPLSAKRRGVGRLMVVGCERIRHEDRRRPGGRQFGQRRSAGAGDHEIGRGIGVRRIVEIRHDRRAVRPTSRCAAPCRNRASPRDEQHLPAVAQRARVTSAHRFVDRARALAAAHREDRFALGSEPERCDRGARDGNARRRRAHRTPVRTDLPAKRESASPNAPQTSSTSGASSRFVRPGCALVSSSAIARAMHSRRSAACAPRRRPESRRSRRSRRRASGRTRSSSATSDPARSPTTVARDRARAGASAHERRSVCRA